MSIMKNTAHVSKSLVKVTIITMKSIPHVDNGPNRVIIRTSMVHGGKGGHTTGYQLRRIAWHMKARAYHRVLT